jgi:hypothetical protein
VITGLLCFAVQVGQELPPFMTGVLIVEAITMTVLMKKKKRALRV